MVSPAVVGPSTPEAIRVHDRLLLILAPDSMSSEWVKTEIAKARRKEIRDGRRVLFPLRLCSFEVLRDWECFDADAGKDSAREIREVRLFGSVSIFRAHKGRLDSRCAQAFDSKRTSHERRRVRRAQTLTFCRHSVEYFAQTLTFLRHSVEHFAQM
jgi:hypothetical protein